MSIRDNEIKRLVKYSEGLGLPVKWKEHVPYSNSHGAALFYNDQDEPIYIEMVTWPNKSKTQIILDFIHELAHYVSYIRNGRITDPDCLTIDGATATREHRKIVYKMEKRDSEYQEFIYNELNIKIPKWKLLVDKYHTNWQYKYEWLTGKSPDKRLRKKKKKELIWRYKDAT